MKLLVARTEAELKAWSDDRTPVVWLGSRPGPATLRGREVALPEDPSALEGWLQIRRLGDELIGGRSVKDALAYKGVSLWWFVHYWLVYGHGLAGWDERYRTLRRLLAAGALEPSEIILLSRRADDDLVVRTFAEQRRARYRWAAPFWVRWSESLRLRWSAEALFRLRMAKLIVRGFLARRIGRNSLAGRQPVDLVFNTSSSTWNPSGGVDRVLGPLIDQAQREHMTVAGLHLDHRRNLGLDTLRQLDRRIVAWESLVSPKLGLRALLSGRTISRTFGGPFPGTVHGLPAAALLADRLPVLFGTRLADAIMAIETCREALTRLAPRCVYIIDAYDLWGRALVVAARDGGIRSIEVQHGIIGRSHDGYLHLEGEVSPKHDYRTPYSPIPDLILVHGDAAKETLVEFGHIPAEAVRVTGSPQIEAIRRRSADQPALRQALGMPANSLVALYFGAPFHVFPIDEDHLRAFLECCSRMPALRPLLRPHPGEYNPDRYVAAAQAMHVEAPVLRQWDPFELIVASDIVISHNSTTALDAMVLERTVIHINMSSAPDMFPFVEEGHARPARTADELFEALTALSEPEARKVQARLQAPYANRYYAQCPDPAKAILDAGFSKLVSV